MHHVQFSGTTHSWLMLTASETIPYLPIEWIHPTIPYIADVKIEVKVVVRQELSLTFVGVYPQRI